MEYKTELAFDQLPDGLLPQLAGKWAVQSHWSKAQVPFEPGLFQVSFVTAQVTHFASMISVTSHISTEFRSSNK